jgi:hypothetical protein
MLNSDSISKSVILLKVLVKNVHIKGISPDVKMIAKFWTGYTLLYPMLSHVRDEVSSCPSINGLFTQPAGGGKVSALCSRNNAQNIKHIPACLGSLAGLVPVV